jgi:hypothetical protein
MMQMIAREQVARQKAENPRVGGSIPPLAATPFRVYPERIGDDLCRRYGHRFCGERIVSAGVETGQATQFV